MLELALTRRLTVPALALAAAFATRTARAEEPATPAAAAPSKAAAPAKRRAAEPATRPPAVDAAPVDADADPRGATSAVAAAPPSYGYAPPGDAPPGYGYAPPGYAPPGQGFAPPGYGPPPRVAGDPMAFVDYPPPMRPRSSDMVLGGVLLLSFGGVALIAGSAMISAHVPTDNNQFIAPCADCPGCGGCSGNRFPTEPTVTYKPGMRTAGIATLVGSAVAMTSGIVLVAVGAKKVPDVDGSAPRPKDAALTPTFSLGSGGASLVWQF